MDQHLDLTHELAKLMCFTAAVATAIRTYSAYNQSGPHHEHASLDLMFLSDSLHSFSRLGQAIGDRNPAHIHSACEALLSAYRNYQVEDSRWGLQQAKYTFDRNANLVNLQDAIDAFNSIQAKVAPLVTGDQK